MSEATETTAAPEGQPAKPEGPDPRIAELSRESASYRAQRNQSLRREAAYGAVLKAHGIKVELDADALASLPIASGRVDGEYPYKAPKIESGATAPRSTSSASSVLTVEEIKAMKPDEVNRRWDEVQAVLKATRS